MITQITPHYARAQFCSDYFNFSILKNFEKEKSIEAVSIMHHVSKESELDVFVHKLWSQKRITFLQRPKQKASRFRIMAVTSFLNKKMAGRIEYNCFFQMGVCCKFVILNFNFKEASFFS